MNTFPWKNKHLLSWSIVGMNHYHLKGKKYLFVSMAKNGRCITAEGLDNHHVWGKLITQAKEH
jgi:hypothetical protein